MKRKERNRETNSTNHHIMRRKKKKMKVMKIRDGPLVEKLDPDTQLDIISRLPFKEAVRCRLVCKSWRILLDDNFLINNHHAKNQTKLSYEYHNASNYSSYSSSSSSSSSSSRLSFISVPTSSSTHTTDSIDDEDDSDATDSSDDEDELFLNLQEGVEEEEEEEEEEEDSSDDSDATDSSSTHSTDTIDSSDDEDDSDATDSSESSDDEDDSNESSDDVDELFLNLPKGVDDDDIIFGVYDDDMYSYKESRSNYKYPSSSSFRNARIISSCNGLICMSKPDSISIYNPITQENLNIHSDNNFTYGFGCHPSTKQYKILRCSHYKYKILRRCTYVFRPYWFEIYTLGTTGGKWRQIKTPKNLHFDYHFPGVHVNGALYWITDYFENKKKTMILSFDLGDDEEFRIITSLPPSHSNNTILQQTTTTHYKLGESQGSLYLIVDHFEHSSEDGDPYIEIWLMMKKEKKRRRMPEKTETTKKKKKNNNNKYKRDHMHHYSWAKVMKIGTDHHRKGEYEFAGLTKTGKVLFWYNHVLTCFDHKTERFESLSSSSDAYPRTFVPHVNSLVSLKAFCT